MTLKKNRSRALIIELIQERHWMYNWFKFGGPALNLWQFMYCVCAIFSPVTLKSKSRLPIIELDLDILGMHLWCEFGEPASNPRQVMVSTVFVLF